MDIEPRQLVVKVWRHAKIEGNVWTPHILDIGRKDQRFNEGKALNTKDVISLSHISDDGDWYWTPAVSNGGRKASDFGPQRVLWVDCDDGYDAERLSQLKPSFVWSTSRGHRQAVWLMTDPIDPSEFHRDGLMGLLTQVCKADKSGVDIGQLLRFPGTVNHKGKPYRGKVLAASGRKASRGMMVTAVAKALGFPRGMASEMGADDPYGDRSKLLWKYSRTAAELGLDQDLTFKLLKACKWNKWRDQPELLHEDIAKAYASSAPAEPAVTTTEAVTEPDDEELAPWHMLSASEFGPIARTPIKWVVPNVIPEGGCGLLVSSPKVGKTRSAIEIALGVATGTDPLGISIKHPSQVGFFSLEDGTHLFSSRMDTILNHDVVRGKYHWDGHISSDGIWHPGKKLQLHVMFDPIDLSGEEDKDRLRLTIRALGLKLVIIDTLSMAIGKANVNDSKDMYAILKGIKEIAQHNDCSILFIHHTRKRVFDKGESIQEMVRGSTALHAWADYVLTLAAPEQESNQLRMGVQTKMSSYQRYLSPSLKMIKAEPQDDE